MAWRVVIALLIAGCSAPGPPIMADAGTSDDCPHFGSATELGRFDTDLLNEASGIVEGRRDGTVLWTHEDEHSILFAVDRRGALRGRFVLTGTAVEAKGDLEDIAIGPGPTAAEAYVYLGDIGDNDEKRSSIRIYRAIEPTLSGDPAPRPWPAESMEARYPDRPHNAETLWVDPASAELYVVTKVQGPAQVFKLGVFRAGASVIAEAVATVEAPITTGGDISADGRWLALRGYGRAGQLWERRPNEDIASALTRAPCVLPIPEERHGEALGFAADGTGFFTTSERKTDLSPEPISFTTLFQ
ncbi:MAG: hypothetical protein U1E65_01370 [Myxococcota bacterium]